MFKDILIIHVSVKVCDEKVCVTVEGCSAVHHSPANVARHIVAVQSGKIIPEFYGPKKQADFVVLSVNISVI